VHIIFRIVVFNFASAMWHAENYFQELAVLAFTELLLCGYDII